MRKYFFILALIFFFCPFPLRAESGIFYERGLILDMAEKTRPMAESDDGYDPASQGVVSFEEIKVKIVSGDYKGEERVLENSLRSNPVDLDIKTGDKVILYMQDLGDGQIEVQIHDYYRLPKIIWLVGLFLLLMILIGGIKGLRAIVGLAIAVILIFKVYIPMVLNGISPVWLTLGLALLITVTTLFIISGRQKKTYAAVIGTIGGLITAVIFAIIFGNLSRLSGLSSEEARILLTEFSLDYKGILFAGIMITALGAVMDVAMSVASGLSEIKKANSEIELMPLFKSGIEIGRDIIGTMSNTLIFAYVGSSLFMLLLFTQFGESYLKFFNFDFVAEEIIGAICGSIGLILTVPITALVSAYLETRK